MRECKNCGTRLGHRNPERLANGFPSRELCQHCFNYPNDEERCKAITVSRGKRCKLRRLPESKGGFCGCHRKLEDA